MFEGKRATKRFAITGKAHFLRRHSPSHDSHRIIVQQAQTCVRRHEPAFAAPHSFSGPRTTIAAIPAQHEDTHSLRDRLCPDRDHFNLLGYPVWTRHTPRRHLRRLQIFQGPRPSQIADFARSTSSEQIAEWLDFPPQAGCAQLRSLGRAVQYRVSGAVQRGGPCRAIQEGHMGTHHT